jgi:hypothetical protein
VFSKIWLEKHGDAALQDSWAFAELDNFVPSRKERVIEEYFGEDQRVGEICPLARCPIKSWTLSEDTSW